MLVVLEWTILGIGLYLALGVVFAAAFVLVGVQRVSPAARGSGWAFRLLIAPGATIFWPTLAILWVRPAKPPAHPGDIEQHPLEDAIIDPEAETKA